MTLTRRGVVRSIIGATAGAAAPFCCGGNEKAQSSAVQLNRLLCLAGGAVKEIV